VGALNASGCDWQLIGLAIASLTVAIAALEWCRRLRRENRHLLTALNNMSKGLCLFDASPRLILCNGRYMQMYGLSPELTKPGCSLRDLLEQRKRANTFIGDPDEYIADAKRRMAEGNSVQDVREMPGGPFISVSSRPIAGGGWVATHQDVTERRREDQQKERLAAQEQRRTLVEAAIASFRARIEAMLNTVNDSAVAMRTTASKLFESSNKASQRAVGAVHTSNEASTNVEIAASAANELSASIKEINRQLAQTTKLVGIAAGEARASNDQISSLAAAAQKIGDVVKLIQGRDRSDQSARAQRND
jgi:hypothetical protein